MTPGDPVHQQMQYLQLNHRIETCIPPIKCTPASAHWQRAAEPDLARSSQIEPLLDRLVARPERTGRPFRKVALSAREAMPVVILRPAAIYGPRDVEILDAFKSVKRGLFPMAGFFSKDEILFRTFASGHAVLWIVGVLTSLLTATYMFRLVFLTFFGKPRGGAKHFIEGHDDHGHDDHGHDAAHDAHDDHGHAPVVHGKPLGFAPTDSPWQITVPLLILAALAVVSGYLNAAPFHIEKFGLWLESSIGLKVGEGLPAGPEFSWANAVPSILLVAAGFAVSAFLCVQVDRKSTRLNSSHVALSRMPSSA